MKLLLILVVAILAFLSIEAKPRSDNHNHWKPSDPRCSGANGSGGFDFRFRRHVSANSMSRGGHYWRFNANSGSCEMVYGGHHAKDNSVFASSGECDRVCKNVYHFS